MGTLFGLRRAPARVILACALAWLAWPASADAGMVKFIFHAEDESGRTARLRLTFRSDAPTSMVLEEPGVPGGLSEFTAGGAWPMLAEAWLDGEYLRAERPSPSGEDFVEASVADGYWPPHDGRADYFGLYVAGERWRASIGMASSDPDAILTHLLLPTRLDLDKFDLLRVLEINDFRGTITAIAVPEPASLALAACGLAGAAAFAGLGRRRAA